MYHEHNILYRGYVVLLLHVMPGFWCRTNLIIIIINNQNQIIEFITLTFNHDD